MKKLVVLVTFFALTLLHCENIALAAGTSLGSSFECSGTAVFKDGAQVNVAKLKKNLNKHIAHLKSELATARANGATKHKLHKLVDQIRESKATRDAIKACAGGVAIDPIWSRLVGQYSSGICQDKTLGLTSNTRAGFVLNGSILSGEIVIDGFLGQLFGGGKLRVNADVAGISFPASLKAIGTPAGDIELIVSQDGHLQLILTNVSSAQVERAEINAQLTNSDANIAGNFSIARSGGSIFSKGSFYLSR